MGASREHSQSPFPVRGSRHYPAHGQISGQIPCPPRGAELHNKAFHRAFLFGVPPHSARDHLAPPRSCPFGAPRLAVSRTSALHPSSS